MSWIPFTLLSSGDWVQFQRILNVFHWSAINMINTDENLEFRLILEWCLNLKFLLQKFFFISSVPSQYHWFQNYILIYIIFWNNLVLLLREEHAFYYVDLVLFHNFGDFLKNKWFFVEFCTYFWIVHNFAVYRWCWYS